MTTCPKCHYTRRPEDTSPDYECPKCGVVYAKFSADADLKDRVLRARSTGNWMGIPREHVPREMLGQVIARIPASTTPFIPGRDILEAVDVVSAECAYGMNVFKDFFTGVTDKVGGAQWNHRKHTARRPTGSYVGAPRRGFCMWR